jgi:hypothetical protein
VYVFPPAVNEPPETFTWVSMLTQLGSSPENGSLKFIHWMIFRTVPPLRFFAVCSSGVSTSMPVSRMPITTPRPS